MFPIHHTRCAMLALLWGAMPLVATTGGSVTATLALGKPVSETLQLGRSGVSIALPEGEWRVSGLVRPREAGPPSALAVLTQSEGDVLAGTVWARAVGDARVDSTAMWCSDRGARQHVEPIVDAGGTGCWWVRIWTTALAPEDLQPYWRQAFSRLRQDGIQLPRALIAAGYHLVGADRTLTVEYSFNATQATVEEVKQWSRDWQDRVRAAFAERPEPFAARSP